jgi:ATP-dependent RNA helicase RhlE
MNFSDFGLSEPVLRAVLECGYDTPTPIQAEAIPVVMSGADLIASAQTGTGKTAAFMLPIIDDIARRGEGQSHGDMPLALVLAPTRELAVQIDENTREYGKHVGIRTCVVLGGVASGPQIQRLRKGVDVVIGTPGRLIDLFEQGELILEDVDFLVLDEADRMLDMGFIHDVRWISEQVPRPRQTLLFSATISPLVKSLASSLQTDAKTISVAPPASIADNIEQRIFFVEKQRKRDALLDLLEKEVEGQTLVFVATKSAAALVARQLEAGGVRAEAISSDRSQSQRQRALEKFTKGQVRVLVATDIVARGIDVDGISHVINYEMPPDPENYIHRIGRTARAGREGVAISLCCVEDISYLRGVQRLVKEPMSVVDDHTWHSPTVAACLVASERAARQKASRRRR